MGRSKVGQGTNDLKEWRVGIRDAGNRNYRAGTAPLLTRLLGRAGVVEVPPPAPPKRPRGRPRKAVAELSAQVWSDVTGGDGVVLVDGKEVPPSDAK